jgi:hypothetical protein
MVSSTQSTAGAPIPANDEAAMKKFKLAATALGESEVAAEATFQVSVLLP